MIGRKLAHFEISDRLGAGGMGEVYLARDTRLERKVALKVLPEEVADDPERLERLVREAKALAALDHPHIVTVFSVDEADGVHFLTMAYVEGRLLRELIPEEGLPVETLLDYAIPLADALRAAHERGIIHRDLKPSNVIVDTDGRLRVLDFGLAKRSVGADFDLSQAATKGFGESVTGQGELPEPMTREGAILGSYPYMSPEQAEGRPVDARSDLFSLGTMIYEMACGRRPFEGATGIALITAILRDDPADLAARRPDVPARLVEIVERCLQKDPEGRYGSAADLHDELTELRMEVRQGTAAPAGGALDTGSPGTAGATDGTSAASSPPSTSSQVTSAPIDPGASRYPRSWQRTAIAAAVVVALLVATWAWWSWRARDEARPVAPGLQSPPKISSIAVLPLENLSGDPEHEYFADGMTETLTTDLSKIGSLHVISRTSAMRYKRSDKPLPEIARELGVDAIIEGSVIREGDQVRITAQLIDAATDRHLWAESFQREITSVLALQGEIAQAVAREIEVTLTPEEERRLAAAPEVDPEAYEAYLKGTFHLNKLTPDGIEKGLALLHEAIAKDPGNPLPYAGLARGYSLLASHTPDPPPDAFQRAQAAYRRALELDPDFAEAHAAMAERKLYLERNWEGAEESFRKAIELNPSLPGAHAHYAWLLNLFDRQQEAVAEIRQAVQVDPLTPLYAAWSADIHAFGGDFDRTLEEAERLVDLYPEFPWAQKCLGGAYSGLGRHEEAIAALQQAAALDPIWTWRLGLVYARAGRAEEARRIATELEADVGPLNALALALIRGALGEKDEAFRWLDYEPSHPWLPWIRTWPGAEPLHDDPRFQRFLDRLDLPPIRG